MEKIIILLCIYFTYQGGLCTSQVEWGIVRFNTGPSDVQGSLFLYQSAPENPTIVYGWVYNMKANSRHGFHIHETGDFSNACISTGPHYNPRNFTHGSRLDDVRHAGDLSNIETNDRGIAVIYLKDEKIQLSGPESIIGRAFVVHELEDDEGRGDNDESKRTGNAGARIKCGIVGKYIPRQ